MAQQRRVAIVTDSTSDLPRDVQSVMGISVIPLNVHFGDETYRDQVDLSTDAFFDKLATAPALPTTSQPSAGTFETAFRGLAAEHQAIVCVTISGKLSGTLQSAKIAAEAVAETIPVEIVDSRSVTYALGFQAIRAAGLARQGHDASSIAATLRAESGTYEVVFFVETLEHLRRGGRIGKAAQLVGSLLQLKPLLRLDEGQIVPFERTRTRSRALKALEDFALDLRGIDQLAVIYNTTPDDAARLKETLVSLVAGVDIPVIQFGPVVATHIGPGVVGLAIKERPVD